MQALALFSPMAFGSAEKLHNRMCYQHRTASSEQHDLQLPAKEPCLSQGWIRKAVIAPNHINREDRMSGSHSASLRAAIPVTCESSQTLWMMEWFNITGSGVCGRAAQDINTGSNIVHCQPNCLAGGTGTWKDGSLLGPSTHTLQRAFLLGRTLLVRTCMSMESKQPSPSWVSMGRGARPSTPVLQEASASATAQSFSTSKIGTWQTKPAEFIAKQNILPSPNTRTACYRALANS